MPIPFKCEHCQAAFEVPDQHAGKRAKCPKCGQPIQVPMAPDTSGSSMKLRVARPLDAPAPAIPPPRPPEPAAEPPDFAGIQINVEDSRIGRKSSHAKTEKAATPETPGRTPVTRRKKKDPLPWVLAGGAGAVLIAVVAAWLAGAFSSNPPNQPAPNRVASAPAKPETQPAAKPTEPNRTRSNTSKPHEKSSPQFGEWNPSALMPVGFSAWSQNFDRAQKTAKQRDTQILLVFSGSDWEPLTQRLVENIFDAPQFLQKAKSRYELVVIDVPRTSQGHSLLEDRIQNTRLLAQFDISNIPTVALTDADGLPYAVEQPEAQGLSADRFLDWLDKLGEGRTERDKLLAATREGADAERLAACVQAVEWLSEKEFTGTYAQPISEWLKLARRADADNAAGQQEIIFQAAWLNRLAGINPRSPKQVNDTMQELLDFSEKPKFKDADLAVKLFLSGAKLMYETRNEDWVFKLASAATQHAPQDPDLAKSVKALSAMLKNREQLGSGTGFVIAKEGYILTNHHVIDGDGRVVVRLAGKEDPVSATVIEKDEDRDLALLKIAPEHAEGLQPIQFQPAALSRGAKVAAFGFPLGDIVGSGIKLTTGIVSALPDAKTEGMLVLDCRVNPGNSGGPLCNPRGQVVGVVTAKSFTGDSVDSYGMAVPASEVLPFLTRALPDFQLTLPREGSAFEWDQVDQMVSPSVVMILKLR